MPSIVISDWRAKPSPVVVSNIAPVALVITTVAPASVIPTISGVLSLVILSVFKPVLVASESEAVNPTILVSPTIVTAGGITAEVTRWAGVFSDASKLSVRNAEVAMDSVASRSSPPAVDPGLEVNSCPAAVSGKSMT